MLPIDFTNRMKQMLQEEYASFAQSYEKPEWYTLRVNTLKGTKEEFLKKQPWELKEVPWNPLGFYYKNEERPGKHPYHEAGVYYIQEASAMAPVMYLNVTPGDTILDLCAAPGGKSTQIAAMLQGEGLLVANEIHSARAKILSENVERMGVKNAIVTSETPQKLEQAFEEYFDKILVDAPCSGEGMFRKHPEACEEWSLENVQMCADRQDEILDCAHHMLKPGGRIVYSTCTFAPAENEGTISRFISRHPQYHIVAVELYPGMAPAKPMWADADVEGIERTIRLWPHKLNGEGHYVAVLEKAFAQTEERKRKLEGGLKEKEYGEYLSFERETLKEKMQGVFLKFGDQLYLAPENTPALKNLRVLRPGLHLGTLKKNRLEPSHALALALNVKDVYHVMEVSIEQATEYMKGQTFSAEGEKGWYLLTVDGYSIGWGKLAGGIMKNHYPKGLRK